MKLNHSTNLRRVNSLNGNHVPQLQRIVLAGLLLLSNLGLAQIEQESQATAISSEAPSLRFEQLSLQDGMQQSSANTIMQDKNGFLWVATQGGLHRYDGYEFKVYGTTPFDTTSLSDSWVWAVSESAGGDMWVTTESGGLNRLDPVTGKAVHYRHDPDDSTSISSDRLFYPLETSNGDLWVGSFGHGLNRMLAGKDGQFIHYRHNPDDPNTLSSDNLYWLTEDNEQQIWAGSNNGINRLDPVTGKVTRYLDDQSKRPGYNNPLNVLSQYVPPGESGIIWLATGNGLVRLNYETGEFKRFLIETGSENYNPLNYIHEVRPDPNDNNVLWVAGPGTGVARFDMRTEKFTSYRHDPRDQNSLRDDMVVSLFTDRSGTMWAGTGFEGLNAFNPVAVNFTHIKHDPEDPSSLSPGIAWGVYEDKQGSLWVGTDVGSEGHYLTRFDGKTRRVQRYRHDRSDPNTLLWASLRCFAEDKNGGFWVAGGGGLSRLDRVTGRVDRFRQAGPVEVRRRNNIFWLEPLKGSEDTLLIGSFGGLDKFDTNSETYSSITLSTDTTASEPIVLSFYQDALKNIWAGTSRGLFRVDPSGKTSHVAEYDAKDTTGISNNNIYCIVERDEEPGILWLGSTDGGGLNRFDTRTGTAQHITTKDGLADNTIYGLLVDNNGTLWMSTNGGISNYNPDTKQIRNYGLDDGLMALEYSQNGFFKGKNGTLYFGSGNGVTAFTPEQLKTNEIPPQLAISDVKIFNKSIAEGGDSTVSLPSPDPQKLTLDYDQNEVTIDFVALHFANSKKNQYRYQLEGFDAGWTEPGTKRSVSYTNLPPGNYTFRVIASNADGVWNEEGASMQISVLPPWYRTPWAYVLFAFLFGLGVFAVDRLQRYRLRKIEKERAVLREAELRAEAENKRRADTEELSKIGRTITSSLSMDKIIEIVYTNVNALMDAAIFGVGIYNEKKNRLDFPATKEEGEKLPAYSNDLDDDNWLSVWCFRNNEEILIGDFDVEKKKYISSNVPPIVGKSPASVIYMPLIQQDRTIGVITTQSFTKNAYTEYHVNLLRNLANYAAIALDNASAYRKLNSTLGELRSTQQQLVHAEKMASLGELTAGIAHEIQNPLNFVNNFADVNAELIVEIAEEIENGNYDEVKDLAKDLKANEDKIVHHGKRAQEIVRSMLQHSRGSEGVKEKTDLNALCDEFLRLSYHGLRAKDKSFNADFRLDLDNKLPKVKVVPQDIGRVLLNLINNAFHAVNGVENPTVKISTSFANGQVEIKIIDNGSGIPPEIRDKIFQPFFTTKPTGEGTGLGLSMSYEIITKGHDGELKVETEVGKGTTFSILLPV